MKDKHSVKTMTNTPKKTTEEWREWEEWQKWKENFCNHISDWSYFSADEELDKMKENLLSLERKRVAEEIVGMAWVSEVCNCPGPKMWVMNRCMVCKKVGIDQRTANQALSSLIAKVKEKYL